MLLALLPISAGFPANRLLIFVGLGAMGLLAQFLACWFEKPAWLPTSRAWRWTAKSFVLLFIFVHFIAAPILLPFTTQTIQRFAEVCIEKPLLKAAQSTSFSRKKLIFINPPNPFAISSVLFLCQKHGLPIPAKTRVLASGMASDITIERMDDFTMEVEPENGFISNDLDGLFRGSTSPMQAGQIVEMGDMQAEVLTLTEDQRPKKVRFTFSRPLNDKSLTFYEWKDGDFAPFTFPNIGQSITLAMVKLPF